MELVPLDNGWKLPVDDQMVTRCCIDNECVTILCQNLVEITISEPFMLISADGNRHALDPDPSLDPRTLAPLLGIMRQVIGSGVAFNDGRLELLFQDGAIIGVPPGADYEAWTLTGPGGPVALKVISVPGGDLAIWPAH